jgi:hypothetical protein
MINTDDSNQFIAMLTGKPDTEVTFQTFSDSSTSGKELNRVVHGSLSEHVEQLSRLNDRGAGVFVMVNEGDRKGRRAANVIAVRAAFVDLDDAPLTVLVSSFVPPHIVIESSPNRYHAYWRVTGCPVDSFTPLQKNLAERFGGDPRVCDLPRVMRLPGFYHRKAAPFLTRIISCNDAPPIPFEQFLERMGLIQKRSEVHRMTSVTFRPSSVPAGLGDRNRALFDLARTLKAADPEMPYETRRLRVRQWFETHLAIIGTKDFAIALDDFERGWANVKSPKGSTLRAVIEQVKPAPPSLERLGYGDLCLHLCSLMFSLHEHQQQHFKGDPIIMSCRTAGEVLGVDKGEANKLLHTLERDSVIELVELGAGVRASRWRWIWKE